MKKLNNFVLILFLLISLASPCLSNTVTPKYSNNSVLIYNQGVAFHKKGEYSLAIEKYKQTLKIQPNFIEAKQNLIIAYNNLAQRAYSKEDYNSALLYAKKALEINQNKADSYGLMANCYQQMKDYDNLILICDKLLTFDSKDDITLNMLAMAYIKTNQNEKAQEIYKKILLINPKDSVAKQNLSYVNYQLRDKQLTQALNTLKIEEHAPKKIYRMVKREWGIPRSYKQSMIPILDLIWSEPSGRTLLTTLSKARIPIKIVNANARATTTQFIQYVTYYDYGMERKFASTSTVVNIPTKYIDDFNNSNLSARDRIESLTTFVHEFGHAFMLVKDSNNKDSIEEEIGVSMIGYNLASKVLTGEYLTREQARDYGTGCLQGAFEDDHRKLPLYSNFERRIKFYGIELPYPEEYANLALMYRKLVQEGKIVPVNDVHAR